jgi:glycine/D-amino acid oxidase-like deaminating enzyme
MQSRANVIVIGTSIAYYLAQRGVRDVVLVEADMG